MNTTNISETAFSGLNVNKLFKSPTCETLCISIEATHSLPTHTTSKEALLVMHSGEAIFYIQSEKVKLTPGVTLKIPINIEHSIRATENSILFVFR